MWVKSLIKIKFFLNIRDQKRISGEMLSHKHVPIVWFILFFVQSKYLRDSRFNQIW